MGEPRQLVLPCPHCGDNRVVMARQVKKEEVESNPIFAEFLLQSRANTPPVPPTAAATTPSVTNGGTAAYRRPSKGSR